MSIESPPAKYLFGQEEQQYTIETCPAQRWEGRLHVVIIPKYGRQVCFGRVRCRIGNILPDRCKGWDIELLEGPAMLAHVRMWLSIPPQFSVASRWGSCKGRTPRNSPKALGDNLRRRLLRQHVRLDEKTTTSLNGTVPILRPLLAGR